MRAAASRTIAGDLERDPGASVTIRPDARTVRIEWSGTVPGLDGITDLACASVDRARQVCRIIGADLGER